MKLESAHIEEVRGIRKLDINYKKGTFAISGPNGSGKSGVIDAIEFGLTGQIISSLKHRDKAINNALVAKAVEVCERLGLKSLVYYFWSDESLSEFKRHCGFERMSAPRYFVPLTTKGQLYLHTGLHRGWGAIVPQRIKMPLKRLRAAWYER